MALHFVRGKKPTKDAEKSAIHNYFPCGGHEHHRKTLMMDLIEIKVADTGVATIPRLNHKPPKSRCRSKIIEMTRWASSSPFK